MDDATDCGATRAALLTAGAIAYPPGASRRTAPQSPRRSRGQALLILIVMLSIATMLLVYGSTTEIERAIRSEHRSRHALDQAKQALIGRAVADANRPGSLPCPDTDDDGSADLFVGSACPSYIGRLPWRTLGVGDLRDDSGERLWYALTPAFRDHPGAPPLNSATRGAFTVYSNSDAIVVSDQAIAVVFAPGLVVAGQRRDDTADICATTGKAVPRTRCAANYLDRAGAVNNASASGPYIAAPAGERYNDRLAVVRPADLMPLVERRVTLELRNALLAYRSASACGCYPWADSGADGISDAGASNGRIPARQALPHNWPAGTLPPYFAANDWARVILYAVARTALEGRGARCTACGAENLAIDSAGGYDVVLLSTGYGASSGAGSGPHAFVEDPDNADGDERFVTPRAAAIDRNNLHSILGTESGCAAHARALIDNTPCAGASVAVRPVCLSAGAALARCTCSRAAATLTQPPCTTSLGASACELAIIQLRGCAS